MTFLLSASFRHSVATKDYRMRPGRPSRYPATTTTSSGTDIVVPKNE
eukprot:CAMPEP_0116848086 /NCGR_PEP_ID=MMETSP0418-20121206/14797_1 /TAXON_ID=1158023 /ORGANISM="Astrosyne radiata, Strain 13vi08-1A" /LENGTH=46 /DNA_ID= /DNA_START= /DNA_END= /DNA_ORIENTATION=